MIVVVLLPGQSQRRPHIAGSIELGEAVGHEAPRNSTLPLPSVTRRLHVQSATIMGTRARHCSQWPDREQKANCKAP